MAPNVWDGIVLDVPTPAAAEARKGLAYAENELGVHQVHENALSARERVRVSHEALIEQRAIKRRLEGEIDERQVEIIDGEYLTSLGISVAAMERHLKVMIPKDGKIRELRKDLATCITLSEQWEASLRLAEVDTKIAVARMTELGGYLNYLAAIKNQQSQRSGAAE